MNKQIEVEDSRPSEFMRIFRDVFDHTYEEIAQSENRKLFCMQRKEASGTIFLREVIDLANYYGFESYIVIDRIDPFSKIRQYKEWKIESSVMRDWLKDFLDVFGENQTSMAKTLGLHRQKISSLLQSNSMKFRMWIKFLDYLGCRWCLRSDDVRIITTDTGWDVEKNFKDLGVVKLFTTSKWAKFTNKYTPIVTARAWLVSDDSDGNNDVYNDGKLTELYINKDSEYTFTITRCADHNKHPTGKLISCEEAKEFLKKHGNNPKLKK